MPLILSKEYINPNGLFPSLPHGLSQLVIATGKKMVFISGQTAPARAWIGVSVFDRFMVEIETTAVLN